MIEMIVGALSMGVACLILSVLGYGIEFAVALRRGGRRALFDLRPFWTALAIFATVTIGGFDLYVLILRSL